MARMAAERRRELSIGPVGPWAATVRVDAVETDHGRHTSLPHDWLFEVSAEWTGPPAVGFPPAPAPVSARDVVIVESLELARVIAQRAAADFQAAGDQPPDLRAYLPPARGAFPTHPRASENGS